jgi:hypothetical protein
MQLRKDREIKALLPTTLFFAAWGLWNLVYYPTLSAMASFIGGVALVAGNMAWVVMRSASNPRHKEQRNGVHKQQRPWRSN